MTPISVLLIVLSSISLLGIISSILLGLRIRKLSRLLESREPEGEEGEVAPAADGFSPVLRQTDLHCRLQQGRQLREVPEKYRFIRSLADRGVPAAEIAEILKLASGEVDQLMALARVARRQTQPAPEAQPKRARTLIKAKDFPSAAETII